MGWGVSRCERGPAAPSLPGGGFVRWRGLPGKFPSRHSLAREPLLFLNFLTDVDSGERFGHGNRAARGCEHLNLPREKFHASQRLGLCCQSRAAFDCRHGGPRLHHSGPGQRPGGDRGHAFVGRRRNHVVQLHQESPARCVPEATGSPGERSATMSVLQELIPAAGCSARASLVRRRSPDPAETGDQRSPLPAFAGAAAADVFSTERDLRSSWAA